MSASNPGAAGETHALRVPGTLDYNPDRYAEIGVPLQGRISEVAVRLGDAVVPGQVLATLVIPSIADAQGNYLTARAAAVAARKQQEREEALLRQELTTAREAEVARSEAAKAEADVAAAATRLRALKVDLPSGNATVSKAGRFDMKSPIAGVVVKRDAVQGSVIEPNETPLAVADVSELWASLEVFESNFATCASAPEPASRSTQFPTRSTEENRPTLSQLAGSSRSIRARAAIPNDDGQLKPGLFVRAAIELPPGETAYLIVPAEAVQPLGRDDVAFVELTPGTFEIRKVDVFRRTNDVAEIVHGLLPTERIVVSGAFLLRGEASRQ